MTRSHKVLGFLFVTLVGLYGCARGPGAGPGPGTHSPAALEAKVQRLEEDFRAAAAARDSFRQRLQTTEEKLTQLQKRYDQATTELAQERNDREQARTELKTRTTERDNLQTQYDGFRKNIRELLGTAEAALNTPHSPPAVTAVIGTPSPATPTAPAIPPVSVFHLPN